MNSELDLPKLVDALAGRDRRALARAITLVESAKDDHRRLADELIERVLPLTGNALRLGISGAPGVGKSTFIEALGGQLLATKRIAVLAVDPSSSSSGGSLLADKTRMQLLATSTDAFVRPSPAGRTLGGVSGKTREAILLCEAAGYDVVIVETVGVGQSEHAVSGMVDFFLLLLLPGAGDELSGVKRGIVELVDGIVVNQADGDNLARAERTAGEYRSALTLLRHGRAQPAAWVLTASALERRGIGEAWQNVTAHHARLESSGQLAEKRARQRAEWLSALLDEALRQKLLRQPAVRAALAEAEAAVAAGAVSPPAAVRRVLAAIESR
jgi:LAO/AO transport system kinase